MLFRSQYHMHNIFHAFQIPVHWHDELEVIYTKKGPLNLLIDGKEYTAEDGSVYFVAPGQLHLMGSAAGDVDYYTLLFPLEFISFQSDDSLERELFFPLRNHTLSFPCKLPEDDDTAAKASVLLDQIINANSDGIAANQKTGRGRRSAERRNHETGRRLHRTGRDRKSTRLNSSHKHRSRMPSSA